MSVESRMFRHPFRNRCISVDEQGIHEHRDGRLLSSILWDELESIGINGARSRNKRISTALTTIKHREFQEYAFQIWRRRHPDRWREFRERSMRELSRNIYIKLPVIILVSSLLGYILLLLAGWPEELKPEVQKFNRITGVNVVGMALYWVGFRYWKKHYYCRLHEAATPPKEVISR
ncbi:MAG: hypothetical protein ACK4UN_06930 [Limisphaerales bacterium]